MRVWDVNPGYLDRQRLLGEHRELHGLLNVVTLGKKGYARHPETLRWAAHLPALCQRHNLLVSEMLLRGYAHHSPVAEPHRSAIWPSSWIDTPAAQFDLLCNKQRESDTARIPIPRSAQQLWAQHKYSVLARDPDLYACIGSRLAREGRDAEMAGLAELLVTTLRTPPPPGRLNNALQHMWGYLSDADTPRPESPQALLQAIRLLAMQREQHYLVESTALSELAVQLC